MDNYAIESFIDFCDDMEIAQEKSTFRLRAETADTTISSLKQRIADAETKEEKLKWMHVLDKEIDKQIRIIKSTPESAWDKHSPTIKGTISLCIGALSLINHLHNKMLPSYSAKGAVITAVGAGAAIASGASSVKSFRYSKEEMLKSLTASKRELADMIKYTQKI